MEPNSVRATQLALTFVVVIVLSVAQRCNAVFEILSGTRESCDHEGAIVTVDKIPNTKCFNCICKNGFVECVKQQCPNMEGCHAVLKPQRDECCQRCKGCFKNGVHRPSGIEWTEANDPCTISTCNSGIITKSRLRCYTPCANPIPASAGQCCPSCAECGVNGLNATVETKNSIINNSCISCRCNEGRHICFEKACPVLNCPVSRIDHEPGQCCPHCKGYGQVLSSPTDACILGTTVYNSGAQFNVDDCTRCSCTNSTILCIKETCPVLNCRNEHQSTLPGRCCAQCLLLKESHEFCILEGRYYEDGETWKLDRCKACTCIQGKVRCAMRTCPPLNIPCSQEAGLKNLEDQCCPRCVENYGVCTVFGDPHYRTFDGKFFTFKGACRYQLVSDCANRGFSIRVTNDDRSTKSSAWTKTVVLKIGDLRVHLGQKMRVKVNGTKVELPYRVPNILNINQTSDSIIVSIHIGIKVMWDGISFIEVSASILYHGRLCGLCGNFNSLSEDDFTTRRGQLVEDPYMFGQSWAVGSTKVCPQTRPSVRKEKNDKKLCNQLRSQIFEACNKEVDPTMYYESCLQNMSECPTENCYCESIVAYVHECQRHNTQLIQWRNSTRCRSVWDLAKGPTNFRNSLR